MIARQDEAVGRRERTREEAREIARLATVALAEVAPRSAVKPYMVEPGYWTVTTTPDADARRAVMLAALVVYGPEAPATCTRHLPRAVAADCRKVTVAEVLLGRGHDCGAPAEVRS